MTNPSGGGQLTRKKWKTLIVKQLKDLDIYNDSYKSVIETLAGILEQRDGAREAFEAEGAQMIIDHISDRGAVNQKRNPLLQLWQDLNTQALAYWRDLGLTPAGLKRLKDATPDKTELSGLEQALNGISRKLGKSP